MKLVKIYLIMISIVVVYVVGIALLVSKDTILGMVYAAVTFPVTAIGFNLCLHNMTQVLERSK